MTLPPPIEVDRIIENHPDGTHTHTIQLTPSPVQHRQALADLAAAFRHTYLGTGNTDPLPILLDAGNTRDPLTRQDALTKLIALLHSEPHAITIDADSDDATRLAAAIELARTPPATCACGRAVEDTTPTVTDCGACGDARPLRLIGVRP